MRTAIVSSALVLSIAACGWSSDDSANSGGKADSPFDASNLVEGTPPEVGLLRLVNDPDVDFTEAGLPNRTATNLTNRRDAKPSKEFDDVPEIDSVPGIGPARLQSLLDFAFDEGFIPEGDDELGTYDGVTFSVNEADAVVTLVNTANEQTLDVDLGLDSRSVDKILDVRPIGSVLILSRVTRVGQSALESLKDAAEVPVDVVTIELGIISDLDKTIIPPAPSNQEFPDDPYPGMAELLTILEIGDGDGNDGDIHFVTARQPDAVVGVPDWLEENGVPLGGISTGISGIPFLARDEKIRDVTEVFEARPAAQRFVMFGDSSHVDADVYRAIIESFGDKVIMAFIHNVKAIDDERVEGLNLIDNYAEAASLLLSEGLINEPQAREVMQAVVDGGLITDDEMEAMLQ